MGTSTTVTTLEDTPYPFKVSDFGFTDPNDGPANTFLAVKITTVPSRGSLTIAGTVVTAGTVISVRDIIAGSLKFAPLANANGVPYISFTFQVQDNGGTANSGHDTDFTARSMTINVTSVNDPPVGKSTTVTAFEDTPYAFKYVDFGYSDPNDVPINTLLAVKITTLPLLGSLTDNGIAVTAGAAIPVADISNGKLKYTPVANANGLAYTSFKFQVQDNGGTANGGLDTDTTPRVLTINGTSVNDAPVGRAATVTTLEDTPYAVQKRRILRSPIRTIRPRIRFRR